MDKIIVNLAWRNLRRNRRRSIATGMAIAAGFTAFMLAAGYAYRVQKVLSNYTIYGLHVGHIGIYKKDALEMFSIRPRDYALAPADQKSISDAIKGIANIEMSGRYLTGQGLIGNGCKTFPFLATAVDLSVEERVMNHPNFLRWNEHITKLRTGQNIWEFPPDMGAVALSQGLAALLGQTRIHKDFGDAKPVMITDCAAPEAKALFATDANIQLAAGTWDGTLSALDGEVVTQFSTGLTETNTTSVTLGLEHLQKLVNTDSITNVSIWLNNPLFMSSTLDELSSRLKKTAPDLEVLPWSDERLSPYYSGTMQFIYVMVGFIGIVLASVVILSIFNSATMTVIERSQEVGMFRSVGYNQSTIRRLFALEGLFLTGASVVAGAVLGVVVMLFLNSLKLKLSPPGVTGGITLEFQPNAAIALTGALCVSFLGITSTWIAVSGVVRKNIANLVSGANR